MASEDVIELGSSEDEAEPKKGSKKIKSSLNAMVCIPRKLEGVTVKKQPANVPSGSAVTVKKLQSLKNAPSIGSSITVKKVGNINAKNIVKSNGKALNQGMVVSKHGMRTLNPLNVIGKVNNGQVKVSKVSPSSYTSKEIRARASAVGRPLARLPPSITVKKTVSVPKSALVPGTANFIKILPIKRALGSTQNKILHKKRKLNSGFVPKEVLTVELDDDEGSSSPNPSWYIRPEAHLEQSKMKEKNETEPKSSKSDEIVIEDSPVKPVKDKRMFEVGVEFPITIEDSPAKGTTSNKQKTAGSDEERVVEKDREPLSKKKLEYPKQSIEIEIYPMEGDSFFNSKTKNMVDNENNQKNNEMEVAILDNDEQDSEIKTTKNQAGEKLKQSSLQNENADAKEPSDFHPVYQSFIDLCFELENSEDMRKIVEKKIKAYYRQVTREYTESEQFIDLVQSKISLIKASPEKMYLYIKDIVDELNLQRKMMKSQTILKLSSEDKKEAESFLYGEESEFDAKRQRQIRKLEKTLKKLHRAIQKLEEQEVDFDDDEDSVYLLTERYKERMVRVHAKFCQLTNTKMPSEPRVVIDARPGQPTGPAKRLEKYINKKVPIGTPLPFPDFHDVLRCVREANEEDKLGWNEADIMEEARDLFTRCGKKLQRRRQENEWRLAASRITNDVIDPAENNDTLKKKLDENRQVATKKEAEVFNKYADRQCQLKLEGEEIGDKEAEESPVESEEDEPENSDLGNKERRKERLKRLIQEKSNKKVNIDKSVKDAGGNENTIDTTDKNVPSVSTPQNISEEVTTNIVDDNLLKDASAEKTNNEKIEIVSDGSDKIGSDIDELHLLQKLHSENENNTSTLESSDTDTPIDISDTLDSSDNKAECDDVISIENSSYSETEQESAEMCILPDHDTKTENNESKPLSEKKLNPKEVKSRENNEKCPPDVEICDNSSTEFGETDQKNNKQCEESVQLTVTLSEDENSEQNDHKIYEKSGDFNKPKGPSSVELCDNSSVESDEILKLNNPMESCDNLSANSAETFKSSNPSSVESAETLKLNNSLSVESTETLKLKNPQNVAESMQISSEDDNCKQKDGSPSSIEFCENVSNEPNDVRKNCYEDVKKTVKNKDEDLIIELHDNASVESGGGKLNFSDKMQVSPEKGVCEQEDSSSVEMCEGSSVEMCENISLREETPDKNVQSKGSDKCESKETPVLKEFTKKLNLSTDHKNYNIIDIQEIEIAYSPPKDFDNKQISTDSDCNSQPHKPNENSNAMDVDEHANDFYVADNVKID